MDALNAYFESCPMADFLGKKMVSTWWQDYTCAERISGKAGVQDTFNRAWKYWKNDKIYTTELSLVLNWKCWEWYEKGNKEMSKLYQTLWEKLHNYVLDNWKGEDLSWYLKEID